MSEPERVVPLLVTQAFRLLRITSEGHRSPPGFWYDQDEHEWVTLVAGEAELAFEDGARRALSVGEPCYIEARRKHRVVATSAEGPTVWLALFFREAPLDPLPDDHIARIVGHMNNDHADSLLDYATVLADVPDADDRDRRRRVRCRGGDADRTAPASLRVRDADRECQRCPRSVGRSGQTRATVDAATERTASSRDVPRTEQALL